MRFVSTAVGHGECPKFVFQQYMLQKKIMFAFKNYTSIQKTNAICDTCQIQFLSIRNLHDLQINKTKSVHICDNWGRG